MAKIKKPAPRKGGPAKPAPAKKPMRRKSKRALNSALPHVDVTEPKIITSAELAARVMSGINLAASEPKPTLWHRFRSAITGRWVKPLFAKLNPSTTVREKASK